MNSDSEWNIVVIMKSLSLVAVDLYYDEPSKPLVKWMWLRVSL